MDPISLGVGAALTWAAGAYGEHRQRPASPTCGCGHHFALHSEGGCSGVHRDSVLVERGGPKAIGTGYEGTHWKTTYAHEKWEVVVNPCGCRKYVGPEPLPSVTEGY